MTQSVVTLFAGGGGKSLGAKQAGCRLVGAVEYDPDICTMYELNVSLHITCARVEDVDYRPYSGVDGGMLSPSCKNASVANTNAGEYEADLSAAEAVCRFIREARPKWCFLENVWGYRYFRSLHSITSTLLRYGYSYEL